MKSLPWILSLLFLGPVSQLVSDEFYESHAFALDLRLSAEEWVARKSEPGSGLYERVGPLGITNLLAYGLGIDPGRAIPENLPRVVPDPERPEELKILYQRNQDAVGVRVFFQESSDLVTWRSTVPYRQIGRGEISPGVEVREAIFRIGAKRNQYIRLLVEPE